ncbi:MAG: GAF domain-containing protein, partial [Acidobacteria bacterium]|nr:GAF domain-containing protein [Acidobacteriota bacterium]
MGNTDEPREPFERLRENQLSIVARVAVDLSRRSRLEEVYELSIQALLDVLRIDRASLLLFDEHDVMRFVASKNLSSAYRKAVEGHSPWTRQATDAVPITVEDVERDPELASYLEVFHSEGIGALAFIPLVSASGLIGKFMLYVDRPHPFAPDEVNLAWAIATQVALTIDRSRSEQARSSLVSDLRRERNTLRFLATASELLTSTLDPDSILRTIASISVPTLADWCVIDLLEEEGALRRVAVAHKDVEKVRSAQEIQEKYPSSNESENNAVARVIRSGVAELYETVTDEMLKQTARDEEHLMILRELGMTSAMIVPLTARGHKIGCITFVSCDVSRTFAREDLSLATDLAQRAALAVDNARLYERERLAREQAEENARRISRLQEVTAALSEANTPDRVADVIIELGIKAFDAKSGAVAIRTDNHAELIRTIGFERSYIDQFQSLPLDEPGQLVHGVPEPDDDGEGQRQQHDGDRSGDHQGRDLPATLVSCSPPAGRGRRAPRRWVVRAGTGAGSRPRRPRARPGGRRAAPRAAPRAAARRRARLPGRGASSTPAPRRGPARTAAPRPLPGSREG